MSIIIMKLLNGDPTQVPRMGRQDRVNRSTKVWASPRFSAQAQTHATGSVQAVRQVRQSFN
jgi:hypothetical protein